MRLGRAMAGALAIFALGSCSSVTDRWNFCKAENRRIPDAEMKGRLLLNVRKQERRGSDGTIVSGGLPPYMERYLATRLSRNATDKEIESELASFSQKYPLCCQINESDILSPDNPYLGIYPDGDFGASDREADGQYYFANIYISLKNPFKGNYHIALLIGDIYTDQRQLIVAATRAF